MEDTLMNKDAYYDEFYDRELDTLIQNGYSREDAYQLLENLEHLEHESIIEEYLKEFEEKA